MSFLKSTFDFFERRCEDEETDVCETESGRFGECASLLNRRRLDEVRLSEQSSPPSSFSIKSTLALRIPSAL